MRPTPSSSICVRYLAECLALDVESGRLFWKARPADHFSKPRDHLRFNSTYAGRQADAGTYPTRGYRRVRLSIHGRKVDLLAHRAVFALAHGRWPEHEIDHIDRDRANNRPANLRDVPHAVNMRNLRCHAR